MICAPVDVFLRLLSFITLLLLMRSTNCTILASLGKSGYLHMTMILYSVT